MTPYDTFMATQVSELELRAERAWLFGAALGGEARTRPRPWDQIGRPWSMHLSIEVM